MKQYLLSVYSVDGEPELAPELMQQSFKDVDELNGEMVRPFADEPRD